MTLSSFELETCRRQVEMSFNSIYDFVVKDLHDKDFNLSKYDNNQVLLIVNFATNDELADNNFIELKDLKQKYCDGETFLAV